MGGEKGASALRGHEGFRTPVTAGETVDGSDVDTPVLVATSFDAADQELDELAAFLERLFAVALDLIQASSQTLQPHGRVPGRWTI